MLAKNKKIHSPSQINPLLNKLRLPALGINLHPLKRAQITRHKHMLPIGTKPQSSLHIGSEILNLII